VSCRWPSRIPGDSNVAALCRLLGCRGWCSQRFLLLLVSGDCSTCQNRLGQFRFSIYRKHCRAAFGNFVYITKWCCFSVSRKRKGDTKMNNLCVWLQRLQILLRELQITLRAFRPIFAELNPLIHASEELLLRLTVAFLLWHDLWRR
jgi:hypothetical protein